MMNELEKSDPLVVAEIAANKSVPAEAESKESRRGTKGNTVETHIRRTQSRESVLLGLTRVRERAKTRKKEQFTGLLHHITVDQLRSSYFSLKRKAAPGVDRVTWLQYGEALEENLAKLHGRVHRGAYRPQPSRRMSIPKEDGKRRTLGIAALEDKVLQRAVVDVLNAVYEEDFLGFSYGFRPGRSQHDALDALATGIRHTPVNWILDLDVQRFFDSVSHDWLMRFVEHRIGDKRVQRLIRQWLKAGAMEDREWIATEEGTPQGGSASPMLANIYLHYCFDLWAERWRHREARGNVTIVRYADDIVCGFQYQGDARRFQTALRERFEMFALTLHPDKTRLIEFGRFAAGHRTLRGLGKPETFDFLGFKHICGRTREGKFLLRRKTRRDRMRAKLRSLKEELMRRRHHSIPEQGRWLGQVVRGYFAYHAVPTNRASLQGFLHAVKRHWLRALRRRGQRDKTTWDKIARLARAFLPTPRARHPWPDARFRVKHPRWEPSVQIVPARICAGGAQ
ncbi:MAG: group II intron reverse transcriptase/maturase [Pseudomonadales bacterium]